MLYNKWYTERSTIFLDYVIIWNVFCGWELEIFGQCNGPLFVSCRSILEVLYIFIVSFLSIWPSSGGCFWVARHCPQIPGVALWAGRIKFQASASCLMAKCCIYWRSFIGLCLFRGFFAWVIFMVLVFDSGCSRCSGLFGAFVVVVDSWVLQ